MSVIAILSYVVVTEWMGKLQELCGRDLVRQNTTFHDARSEGIPYKGHCKN